jgi:hypothetical protein
VIALKDNEVAGPIFAEAGSALFVIKQSYCFGRPSIQNRQQRGRS